MHTSVGFKPGNWARACLLVAMLARASAVSGAPLYDNLPEPTAATSSVNVNFRDAASFETSATDAAITQITARLRLFSGNSGTTGDTQFSIYDATGTSGLPGAKIADLGSIPNLSMTTSFSTFSIGSLNVALDPATRYWLVRAATTSDEVQWALAGTNTGAGASVGAAFRGLSGTWSLRPQYFPIAAVVAVPEPASSALGLIAAACGACVWLRPKRRQVGARVGHRRALRRFGVAAPLFIMACSAASPVRATPLQFTNMTTANGLASNTVYGVFASGSSVYAATAAGLSVTHDGGSSWTNYTTANGLGDDFQNGVYVDGRSIFAATAGGLSISADGGNSWTNVTMAGGLADDFVYAAYASGSSIYAATAGGLSISTNGGASWSNATMASGLASNVVFSVYASGLTIYVATDGGIGISSNGGATWTNATAADGLGATETYGVYANGNALLAATNGGGLSVSTNSGTSWMTSTTANGLANNLVYGVFAAESLVYAATGGGLSVSGNLGASWTSFTTLDGIGSNVVYAAFADGGATYAATAGGLSVGVVVIPEPSSLAMVLAGLVMGFGYAGVVIQRDRARRDPRREPASSADTDHEVSRGDVEPRAS